MLIRLVGVDCGWHHQAGFAAKTKRSEHLGANSDGKSISFDGITESSWALI